MASHGTKMDGFAALFLFFWLVFLASTQTQPTPEKLCRFAQWPHTTYGVLVAWVLTAQWTV